MPPDQLEQLGTALAGRYSVERELGRGGMAAFWIAPSTRAGIASLAESVNEHGRVQKAG